jgi:hypothetical protein
MVILLFTDRGADVMTNSWSAGSNSTGSVDICYLWGAGQIGAVESNITVARLTVPVDFQAFYKLIAIQGPIADIRHLQRKD